jgi:hypothetical protein
MIVRQGQLNQGKGQKADGKSKVTSKEGTKEPKYTNPGSCSLNPPVSGGIGGYRYDNQDGTAMITRWMQLNQGNGQMAEGKSKVTSKEGTREPKYTNPGRCSLNPPVSGGVGGTTMITRWVQPISLRVY